MEVRDLRDEDWPEVARIYGAGIQTGDATFETEVPPWEAWDSSHLQRHRLVADRGGAVLGWAALSPVSERCCYAGVAEVSVYVAPEAQGQGVGRALLERLVADSEADGIWTLQGGIFPENLAGRAPPALRLPRRRPPRAARGAPRRVARRAPAGAAGT